MSSYTERSNDALSGFYLTLVSIMQSLAFGYLLQIVGSELTTNGKIGLNMVLQASTILLAIVLVWHEYAIGTVAYEGRSWRLDIFDSFIPFLIGIAEYLM